MRVLILTPGLPYPLHQGGAIRNYGIIHGLHGAGHAVTLLSFHAGNGAAPATPLDDLCEAVETLPLPRRTISERLRDLFLSRRPDLAQRLCSDAFNTRLRALLTANSFDLIQFEGLEMATYLPLVRSVQPGARLCYDAHNAEYALQRAIARADRRTPYRWPGAIYSSVQSRRLADFERDVCRRVDLVLAVSAEDAGALGALAEVDHVRVVSNGVFADHYTHTNEQLDLGECALVFTGKMDYRPNVDAMLWFGDRILPLIEAQIPDARLYIVGQKPHARLDRLRDNPRIQITDWVPEIQPYLEAAGVYIAPLRMGSGTRLKILEAMAAGCVVVATSVAVAGLLSDTRQAMIVVDGEAQIADAIIGLLRNPQRRRELGAAAQACVREHHDWSRLIPRLLAAYWELGLG